MMCQRIGLPPISTIGFGRTDVSSASRVPRPPARITAFTTGEGSASPGYGVCLTATARSISWRHGCARSGCVRSSAASFAAAASSLGFTARPGRR